MNLIRVGPFEVYPGERRLCAGGKPVELGARAFDLLLVLAESPGRLVSKATLIERVWPRLVVDENNLPAQIASLRRVLGAAAIRTVPRFGYRLDLPVATSDSREDGAESGRPGLSIPRRSWPERLGALVGRNDDLAALRDALESRFLVTIVGGAGVGKTRLAQELLARESGKPGAGAAWVSLEPLEAAEHVPSAIAIALGLALAEGPDRFAMLRQAIQDLDLLLILDGAEHLAAELSAPLATLVRDTGGLRLLVTSQAPLGIIGETVYRLSPLPEVDAVELFGQRAAQADRRFRLEHSNAPLVGAICRRLDGNPLALELAAARAPSFGLQTLLDGLDDRFRLLRVQGGSQDSRHGVLRTALDWSFGLLEPADQQVFTRLGAFAGSFGLDSAARAVVDADMDRTEAIDRIGRLVDRSLVTLLPTEPPRYSLLETARRYAVERLDSSGALGDAKRRMAAAMRHLVDAAYEEYWSADEAVWLQQFEPEIDNLRAALEWALANDCETAIALQGSGWPLYVETELHAEARAGYDEAIARLTGGLPRARLGRFWQAIATCDSERQCDRARYAAELAATMHAEAGDQKGRYYALLQLVLNWRDDLAAAQRILGEARAVEEPGWPPRLLAHGAMTEGMLLTSAARYAEARSAFSRALGLALTTSERQALAATVRIVELDIACGAIEGALQLGRPLAISLRQSGRRDTRYEILLMNFSALLLAGAIEEARAAGAELFELAQRIDAGRLYQALDAMAFLACCERRFAEAAAIAACADAAHAGHGHARRRPAQEALRSATRECLAGHAAGSGAGDMLLDERSACLLALGLDG